MHPDAPARVDRHFRREVARLLAGCPRIGLDEARSIMDDGLADAMPCIAPGDPALADEFRRLAVAAIGRALAEAFATN